MDLYCKIFVNTELSGDDFISWLSDILSGELDGRTLVNQLFEMDIVSNGDFDKDKLADFVFYPFYLEVDISNEAEEADYIDEVGRLLTVLWSSGYGAVASCEFEDRLPKRV
jgi:hypothetical protein